MGLYFKLAGGYRGDKDGYKIPAGTDIFLSVSRKHLYPFYLCAYIDMWTCFKCNAQVELYPVCQKVTFIYVKKLDKCTLLSYLHFTFAYNFVYSLSLT